jgi:hypothetical protein
VSGTEDITSDEFHDATAPFSSTPGIAHLANKILVYINGCLFKIERSI